MQEIEKFERTEQKTKQKYNLESRLIEFAVEILKTCDKLPCNRACSHLGGQLIRSGTAPALNYGEAQSAESRNDFLHKMKIVFKELRETLICLKIIARIEERRNYNTLLD